MRLIFGERTDPGLVRPNNQDACAHKMLNLPGGGALLVVADGMGGYDGGEIASRLAVETLQAHVLGGVAAWAERGALAEGLRDGIQEANRAIIAAQMQQPALANMGTTLTAVIVQGSQLQVGHVGDSKALLIGPDRALQVTSDHNVPGELLQSGHLTAEQAAIHPQRHVLTRALGVREELPVELLSLTWQQGETLLLCTDGLSNLVSLTEIQSLSQRCLPEELVDQLIDLANNRGGHDNITVLAARWEG
ncbi:MAG: Stp1/IreP family PP2C-type Ser/Thr phosphatase [Bacillota bacterium]